MSIASLREPSAGPASALPTSARFERLLVSVLILLLGARIYVAYEFAVAIFIGAALVPIWWCRTREYVGGTTILAGIGFSIVVGVWLSDYSAADHDVLGRQRILNIALITSLLIGLGLVLWARSLMRDIDVALLFGLGMLAAIRVNDGVLESPWKFGFDKPVSLILLALACRSRNRVAAPIALLFLAAIGAVSGARSRSAILLITLVVVLWQVLPAPKSAVAATVRVVGAVVVVGLSVYQVGQAILLEGALGDAARERTQEQIAQSGSLIVGGRPEMAAAWALMRDRFEGFGFGAAVNHHDLAVAQAGMVGINYDPDNGYVYNFMFGNGIELHSGIGDLWAFMGPVGLLLALSLLAVVGWRLCQLVARRRANAVVVMLGLTIFWDMAFSPLKTSFPFLVIGLGLLLRRRGKPVGPLPDAHELSRL